MIGTGQAPMDRAEAHEREKKSKRESAKRSRYVQNLFIRTVVRRHGYLEGVVANAQGITTPSQS